MQAHVTHHCCLRNHPFHHKRTPWIRTFRFCTWRSCLDRLLNCIPVRRYDRHNRCFLKVRFQLIEIEIIKKLIFFTITMPRNRYANSRCFTTEVLLLIALIGFDGRTTELVTAIITIRYAVTLVVFFNTLPQICTFKLIRRACNRRTIFLVLLVWNARVFFNFN